MQPSGYLTVPAFRNMATFLELDNLVKGGSQGQQSAELANELRRASSWCDDYVGNGPNGPTLGAKLRTEQLRTRVNRDGMLTCRPRATSGGIPVRTVTAVSYGANPLTLTSLTNLTGLWLDGGTVTVPLGGYNGGWSGSLQLGTPLVGAELFLSLTYVSGWPNTTLTADTAPGATTMPLADTTGIRPGDLLTVVDPGDPASADSSSEQVTVLGVTPTAINLTAPLANAHTAADEIGVTALPDNAQKAVAFVARSYLGRRGPEKSSGSFAGSRVNTSTKTAGGEVLASDDYMMRAAQILEPYRRKTP